MNSSLCLLSLCNSSLCAEYVNCGLQILETRYLQKIYGIKIMFNVTGESTRFNWIALGVNIGAMAGIMSVCG